MKSKNSLILLSVVAVVGAAAAGVLVASSGNESTPFLPAIAVDGTTHTIMFHDNNQPSGGSSNEYSDFTNVSYDGNNPYTISYSGAKKVNGCHIELQPNGSMKKTEASNGISSIQIQITGVAWLMVADDSSFSNVYFKKLLLTSGEPQTIEVHGNYWQVVSEGNNHTKIHFLAIHYGCTVNSKFAQTKSNDVQVTELAADENKFCELDQINGTYYLAVRANLDSNYNDKVLSNSELKVTSEGRTATSSCPYRIDCDYIEYREFNSIKAYFNVTRFYQWYFENVGGALDFYLHLNVREGWPNIFKDTEWKNDLRSYGYSVKATEVINVSGGTIQLEDVYTWDSHLGKLRIEKSA